MKAASHLTVFLLGMGLTFAILSGVKPAHKQVSIHPSPNSTVHFSGAKSASKHPGPIAARDAVAELALLNEANVPDRAKAIVNSRSGNALQFLTELLALPEGSYIETSRKGRLIYELLESLSAADLERVARQAFDDPAFLSVQIQLSKGGGLTHLPLSFWAAQLSHMRPELEEAFANSISRDFQYVIPQEMDSFIQSIQSNSVRDNMLARLVRNSAGVPTKVGQAVTWVNTVSSEKLRRALLGQMVSGNQSPDAAAALSAAVNLLEDQSDKDFLREALKFNESHRKATQPERD
jgi:hypothetical protein